MPLSFLFLPMAREMYNKSVNGEQLPVSAACSPLSVHRSLFTVHRSLFTVHCSLILFGYSLLNSYLCKNQPLGSTNKELKNL